MKKFILTILVGVVLIPLLLAEDDIYPLDIQVRVYPEEIHYGDVCFLCFSVTNQGQETLLLPYGREFLHRMGGTFCQEENILMYLGGFDTLEGTMPSIHGPPSFPGRPVKPRETREFHFRLAWIPLPEFADHENAIELRKILENRERRFLLRFSTDYHRAYLRTGHPRYDANDQLLNADDLEGLTASQLEKKRPEYPLMANSRAPTKIIECNLRIQPRLLDSQTPRRGIGLEEAWLIQEWYLELPTTSSADRWTMQHVFAHPYHVRGSTFKMPNATPLELGRKREPLDEAYRAFFKSMETRTPESLARIKRTNDLASQIIERSKHPDSTISQNMVEFIQLRGFLVEMRYAEDEQAEQAAFEKLMNFVDTAQDRELWIRFLDEIGLYSIMHHTHFPSRKVEHYRELFARRFHEVKNLGLTK